MILVTFLQTTIFYLLITSYFCLDTESFNQFDDQPILDSIHSESKQVEYSESYVHHPNSHLPESFHTPKESELKPYKENHRQKRYADYFEYPHSNHQTTLSFQDRRIAGVSNSISLFLYRNLFNDFSVFYNVSTEKIMQ